MTRRRVSNPLALAVLGVLTERPMHPYEISSTLRTRGKEKSIKLNYGSLYSVVETLQRHGLVAARETIRDGRRPERTVYEITEAGRAEFEDWLSELLSVPTREYTSLEAALSLMAGLAPDVVARLLTERAARLAMELRAERAGIEWSREHRLPEIFLIETVFREVMLSAELQFVTKLAKDIRSGTLGGVKTWRKMHDLLDGGLTAEELLADPVAHLGEEGRLLIAFDPTDQP